MRRIVSFVLLAWTVVAAAAETTSRGPLDLRADRYLDAPVVGRVGEGRRVEPLQSEAGWVQVRADGKVGWVRASGLAGDGATVASLARLESGRSASGNLVVAAGIRRIPKASKHALVIAVEAVAPNDRPPRRWPGVADDLASARLIAGRLGVAQEAPGDRLEPGDTLADVLAAMDALNDRVQAGDQLLVYFSGPGTQVAEDGACVNAWTFRDGTTLSAAALVRRLKPALSRVDKVLFVSDAAYAASGAKDTDARKAVASTSPCAQGASGLPIVATAMEAGISAQNLVAMQSAPGVDQGIDVARAGGVFTQALTDCVLGDAVDSDRSTSLSIGELAACVDRRGRVGPDGRKAPLVSVSGNAAWSPIVGVASKDTGSAPAGTTAPRAAIDDIVAQRDGRIEVTLSATPSTLRIGRDDLNLTLTSARAGYVYLVLLGSDGKSFYLLFPNELDRDNRIAAGQALRLPRPNWRVQGQGPAGRDTVLAIVAESERDVAPFAARREGPFSTALTDAEGRAQIQWLLGRSAQAASSDCSDGGARRNLAAVRSCSDAFGAAVVDVIEQ